MRRLLCLVVASLLMSSICYGAEGQTGVYIAPKFVYGLTQMRNVNHDSLGEEGSYGWIFTNYHIGNDTDDAFGGSFAIGYDFNKQYDIPVRTELEYSLFSKVKAEKHYPLSQFIEGEMLTDDQTYKIQSLFLNLYWDIENSSRFTPYIGGGIGVGFIKTGFGRHHYNIDLSSPGYEEEDRYRDLGKRTETNFIWNLGVGVGYEINDNWVVDLGYRFVNLGSVTTATYVTPDSFTTTKTDHLYQHQFSLGIRYTF